MPAPQLHSLYIHWPFCSSKCYYCDFVAFEQHADFQDAYHAALLKEIRLRSSILRPEDRAIKTIFIGGGTPSLYPLPLFEELFDELRRHYDFTTIQEITLEANPADITEERLDTWLACGVNRISCGVQVLDDAALEKLNRRQRIYDVVNAIKLLPKYFDNISMDLIVGLPGVSDATWLSTIETVTAWPLKHLSLYFLTIHEKTPLYYKIQRGELTAADDDQIISAYEKTVAHFERNGFEQYEISNFAKPGYASTHNTAYWDRQPYLGFGIGSSSFDATKRSVNEKNLTTYLQEMQSGLAKPCFEEILAPDQAKMEIFMLTLRQKRGMLLRDMLYYAGEGRQAEYLERIQQLIDAQLIEKKDERIVLTMRGMILENEVVLKLL